MERQVLEVQVQAAEEKKNRLLKAYQKGWLNIEDTEAKLTEVETELKHFTLKLQALNTQRGLTRSYAERV